MIRRAAGTTLRSPGSNLKVPSVCSKPSRSMSKARDFSSQSYSPGNTAPAKSSPVDPPSKSREKDNMVGLNDKFVSLINKVCGLHLLIICYNLFNEVNGLFCP